MRERKEELKRKEIKVLRNKETKEGEKEGGSFRNGMKIPTKLQRNCGVCALDRFFFF